MSSKTFPRDGHFERLLNAHIRAIYAVGHLDNEFNRADELPEIRQARWRDWPMARLFAKRKINVHWRVFSTRNRLARFLKKNPELIPPALARLKLSGATHHDALKRALRPFWKKVLLLD